MLPGIFGGEAGLSGNRASGPVWWGLTFGPALEVYYLIAAYCLMAVAALYAFTLTPLGRLLNAVRDNADRVDFIGYNPQRVRYLAFVIAGFFAGVAGALGALNFETVNPEAFSAGKSGAVLLFTFLGGTASFYGPVLGGVLMVLATVTLSGLTQGWLLYLGLLFMAMVVWVPGGLASWVQTGGLLMRSGQGLELAAFWLRLMPGAGLLFAGTVVAIEMLYHRQMGAAVGPELQLWGLTLNTALPLTWLAAGLAAAAGALVLVWQRKALAARWHSLMDACHAA
jgi:branched-chain amino acid transport system permease protein